MAASSDAGRTVRRAEALVRCWALALAVLAAVTLPVVYVVPDPVERGEPATIWGAVPQVVLTSSDDFGSGDGIGFAVTLARLALLLLLLLLGAAVFVAVAFAEAPAVDEVPGWVRGVVGGGLLLVVLVLLFAAGQVPDADADGVRRGLDVGAGLWAPLVAAVLVLAPAESPWRA